MLQTIFGYGRILRHSLCLSQKLYMKMRSLFGMSPAKRHLTNKDHVESLPCAQFPRYQQTIFKPNPVDATDDPAGAVQLNQDDGDDVEHPIAYFTESLL